MSSNQVFVIAEAAATWMFGGDPLSNAYRSIEAAKACGANAWKTQWASSGVQMATRRGLDDAAGDMYERYLQYNPAWLQLLKAHAYKVGIEFMCTVFLPKDVAAIAPLVKRFKVAAMESKDKKLYNTIDAVRGRRQIIFSSNPGADLCFDSRLDKNVIVLHCISKYPCPLDEIGLSEIRQGDCEECYWERKPDGLSDHTGHVLTGAVAVGAGASVIEAHFRLDDTPSSNCDFPHSHTPSSLKQYIANVRTAERMCQ